MADKFQVRTSRVLSDDELTASLSGGWDEELPAIMDEHSNVLVGNRRLAIAKRNGWDTVVKVRTFGDGPEADAARLRLANVSNIGGAPLTAYDRKRQAEGLYQGGLTQTAIAHMLGVSQSTIRDDLAGLVVTTKPPRPKGGRPKGSGTKSETKPKSTKPKPAPKPAPVKAKDDRGRVAGVDIKADPEAWRKFVDRARSEGKSPTAKITELVTNEVEPPIDVSTLSLSAQEKLQAAINQETRRLKAQFDLEVERKVATRVKASEEYLLAQARKREEADHDMLVAARRVVKANGALMTAKTYKLIYSSLHPDSRKSVSDERLARAFQSFEVLERLIGEEEPVFKSHIGFDLPTPEERAAQRARAKKKQPASANSMARK